MSASSGEDDQEFNSIEDEATYWKNRSKVLEAQVSQLQEKVKQLESKNAPREEDHNQEPAKISTDPFVRLPYDCTKFIMDFLDGSDFYQMAKVSRNWKMIVESDKVAAEKLKEYQTLNVIADCSSLCTKLLNSVEYKHITVKANTFGKLCIKRFSLTIQTLSISRWASKEDDFSSEPSLDLEFPHLENLIIFNRDMRLLEWFSNCKFPSLTSLGFRSSVTSPTDDFQGNDDNVHVIKKFMSAMPKLKRFTSPIANFPAELFLEQFNELKRLNWANFYERIIAAFSTTLHRLGIERVTEHQVERILTQMKDLKKLKINAFINDDEQPPLHEMSTNTSITLLKVSFDDNDEAKFLKMLRALPSLTVLLLRRELLSSTLDVIVRNNLKLEKITCEAISDKTLKEYEELKIKEAGNDKINTSIEIVIKVES